jgi:hypothetical protein
MTGWTTRTGAAGLSGMAATLGVLALLSCPDVAGAQTPGSPKRSPGPGDLPPDRLVVIPIPPPQPKPFQMGFEFLRVVDEDGDLAHPGQSASSVGLRFIFSEGRALRQHLAFAHHWEDQGNISRRGFRLDLVAIGFPIPVVTEPVRFAVEPILRVIRAEVLFVSEDGGPSRSLFRIESGFALGLSAAYRTWFVLLEPLSVDFRYLRMTRDDSTSGFSRVWSLAATIGREF